MSVANIPTNVAPLTETILRPPAIALPKSDRRQACAKLCGPGANENGKAQDQLEALPMSGIEILGVVLTVALLVGEYWVWTYYS
jgi:hypothetical protein